MNPVVSIIIPTYNRAHLIGETIQSVIGQTFSNWEMIIVDDGSTDQTETEIEKFVDPRICYIKLNHCGNLGKVRNVGMEKSKGRFIAFLDSDDLWLKDKLELQLKLLDENLKTRFSFSNSEQFGEGAIATPDYILFFTGNIFKALVINHEFTICMPSLIFDRSIIKEIGLMKEDWKGGGDVEFFFRLAFHFDCVFTNQKLVRIRKHRQNTSRQLGDTSYLELLEIYHQLKKDEWITLGEYNLLCSKIYYRMGLDKLEQKDRRKALADFWKYILVKPLHWKGWIRLFQSALLFE